MKIRIRNQFRCSQGGGTRTRRAEFWLCVEGGCRESFASHAAMARRLREIERAAKARAEKVEYEHV